MKKGDIVRIKSLAPDMMAVSNGQKIGDMGVLLATETRREGTNEAYIAGTVVFFNTRLECRIAHIRLEVVESVGV